MPNTSRCARARARDRERRHSSTAAAILFGFRRLWNTLCVFVPPVYVFPRARRRDADDPLSHRTFSSDSFSRSRVPATALPRPAPTCPCRPRRVAARAVRKKRRLPRFAETTRRRTPVPSQDSNARTKPAKQHDQRIPRVFLTKTPPPPPWPWRASTFRRVWVRGSTPRRRTSSRRKILCRKSTGRAEDRRSAQRVVARRGRPVSSPSSPPRRSRSRPDPSTRRRRRRSRKTSPPVLGEMSRKLSPAWIARAPSRRRERSSSSSSAVATKTSPRVCSTATRRTIHPSRSSRRLNRARSTARGPHPTSVRFSRSQA